MEAASRVVTHTLKDIEAAWPEIHRTLREEYGPDFRVRDDRLSGFDLALAVIALDSQAIGNLFPPELAERLTAWTRHLLNSPEWGEYTLREFDAYMEAFREGLEAPNPRDSIGNVAARLVQRWLGPNVKHFEQVIKGQRTGFLGVLTPSSGRWSQLAKEFEVVEGDLPPDYRDEG